MKTLTHLLMSALLGLVLALPAAASPLLSAAELQARLGQHELRVIDIRSPKDYDAGHIPGALSAPYSSWRGPATNPGELPTLPRLTRLVQQLGLTAASPVVITYAGDDATDFGAAARVYWTLKVLGIRQLAILNGGMTAWEEAGLAQDDMPLAAAVSSFQPTLDLALVVGRDELQQRLGDGRTQLLDARPSPFFQGQTRHGAARVPGTLRGASQLEYTRWFAPDSALMLPPETLKALAATVPTPAGGESVSFCNTGHWAAINWFVLSEVAGRPGVRMYPGSLVEWSQTPGAAATMDHVPGRAGQLWVDLKLWLARHFN